MGMSILTYRILATVDAAESIVDEQQWMLQNLNGNLNRDCIIFCIYISE